MDALLAAVFFNQKFVMLLGDFLEQNSSFLSGYGESTTAFFIFL